MPKPLEVFLLFLRLGFTAFGGPLAHTALFEEEFVKKRGWMSRESFLHHVALTQLIPGPNSTELSMQLGYARAGWAGFFLAGLAFLLPAAVMVALLAWFYGQGGGFAAWERWVWGAMPVVTAVILLMLARTARSAFRSWKTAVPACLGFLFYLWGAPVFSALMLAAGLWLLFFRRLALHGGVALLLAVPPFLPLGIAHGSPGESPGLPALFGEMLFLGSTVFGSGYVLFAYYSAHLVQRLQWFDAQTLGMAITAGQLTPGPLFASAAFFGQVAQGVPGAIACTAGIFLPAFAFCALSIPFMKFMERSPWWKDTLQVLSALCLLIMAREMILLFPIYVSGLPAMAIFLAAFVAILRFRVNSSLLILAGAAAGGLIRGFT